MSCPTLNVISKQCTQSRGNTRLIHSKHFSILLCQQIPYTLMYPNNSYLANPMNIGIPCLPAQRLPLLALLGQCQNSHHYLCMLVSTWYFSGESEKLIASHIFLQSSMESPFNEIFQISFSSRAYYGMSQLSSVTSVKGGGNNLQCQHYPIINSQQLLSIYKAMY